MSDIRELQYEWGHIKNELEVHKGHVRYYEGVLAKIESKIKALREQDSIIPLGNTGELRIPDKGVVQKIIKERSEQIKRGEA